MVSPFTIGISSAAAFGASVAIVFGIGLIPGTEVGIVLNAFLAVDGLRPAGLWVSPRAACVLNRLS
jgi:ABC-type Fe3+-siderophore transport system permease subunit